MSANPYTPPRAQVSDVGGTEEFQPVKIWSAAGRIGRLRYLAYTTASTLILFLTVGILAAILGPQGGGMLIILFYIPFLVFSILIMIQRSHDMDWSGWMILLAIIPLVGFIWIFKSGTPGENSYGLPPPPNTTAVKILGFGMPVLVFIFGILAAIAIPAYQDYVKRAQEAQQSR